jgi:hypothetical protein
MFFVLKFELILIIGSSNVLKVGQPNTSRGPNLIYRTPSGARYNISFRRVVNLQDMNTV